MVCALDLAVISSRCGTLVRLLPVSGTQFCHLYMKGLERLSLQPLGSHGIVSSLTSILKPILPCLPSALRLSRNFPASPVARGSHVTWFCPVNLQGKPAGVSSKAFAFLIR